MPVTRGRRADARRNVTAILDAAVECLSRDPDASVADIAQAAGIGRVTLYGHFASRGELLDAVFSRAMRHADAALDDLDIEGDPRQAMTALIRSSWRIVSQSRALLTAAQRGLPHGRVRELHEEPLRRIERLIERGREQGTFRADVPVPWLVATFFSVLHTAADEITAGRLDEAAAPHAITGTLLAAFTPPGQPVPAPE
ncbi:TetR/AcrR family transcriptional regulator [Streptomyces hainanensis]|uniref:TetR/AcrR family transcriptional regulator n=1 Tax=Streptomyces hainanensis TaxID=402648 RepID=A0A4R4T4U2_9ACTN|nr:TetR/AcrR family transcriptional regulator [Streptomyces hainanensis]TDC70334.1 TetR/AcrR family transcriptional regulator [Streptomyces hainanensis]